MGTTTTRRNASAMKMVGALLALYRQAAGHTQRSLGERFVISEQQIASIEQGRRPLKPDLAEQLDELLGTKGALSVALSRMPEVDLVPLWAEEYLDREREAIAISVYDSLAVPGQLQTERYARAVFRSRVPVYDQDEIERLVATRMQRQEILHRKVPPTASFVIWEAALRDHLGGKDVYTEQVQKLRECADMPGITIQVLPLGRTSHAGLDGPFVLLETPEHQRLAYMETQRGSHLIADPDGVGILTQKYAMLRTQALNTEDSRDLLDRLGEKHERQRT
ncbi:MULTISPECIES: helix-turn-helix domain-containing protein [unclassified Streptomyces]|uniref:helix-turn-helix domain-containing protein n=1 Tax=unclassified Streptomyces TaxID=2593676 RepID=UPI000F6E7A72|nr:MULTISPECIES: helix-turn-helix transcriptional regulator [unclassified Streptomyces]AZM59273.1 transcriptional regulator [Streptomyces sp. WAC 01438]RSM89286.1 transcriptional regulator [Streptomyces sp. WAC 01420]